MGTEKIWVSVVESRLKVLAPNPAISLCLRLRVLMGSVGMGGTGSLIAPWYMDHAAAA